MLVFLPTRLHFTLSPMQPLASYLGWSIQPLPHATVGAGIHSSPEVDSLCLNSISASVLAEVQLSPALITPQAQRSTREHAGYRRRSPGYHRGIACPGCGPRTRMEASSLS